VIKSAFLFAVLLLVYSLAGAADDPVPDSERDILVTFDNIGASVIGGGVSAPYRNRNRYSIAAKARKSANDIAEQFSLIEVDHWPLRSLSIYCFVYRIPDGTDRDELISQLKSDERIESVQPLQRFDTSTESAVHYDDTFAYLQHGLDILEISAAHRISQGKGVRITIIDSDVDRGHEDLIGRIHRIRKFADPGRTSDLNHGTAVASVIGAIANNARGIVGVAPSARLELLVACWSEDGSDGAVCDSFTLARALDFMLDDPPQILNLSLDGPDDALISRLIDKAAESGVIVVAANPVNANSSNYFPAHLDQVIGVGSSEQHLLASNSAHRRYGESDDIYAPGNQIMVALPNNAYDFRSGSSLAAAHVSGVVALLLANSPGLSFTEVLEILQTSQAASVAGITSVNACIALKLINNATSCI